MIITISIIAVLVAYNFAALKWDCFDGDKTNKS